MARVSIVEWIAKKIMAAIAIVEDTDTAVHAIDKDKYVIWKSNPCKALEDISIGDTLSSSNLGSLQNGISNDSGAGSSLYRQFWDDTNQIELELDDDGKTYLVWCAASTAGTSGEIGDATYGALILVSDGKYSIVNKGSGITVTKSSDQLTISSTANIAMAIVEI